jgi:hypothetical protein
MAAHAAPHQHHGAGGGAGAIPAGEGGALLSSTGVDREAGTREDGSTELCSKDEL